MGGIKPWRPTSAPAVRDKPPPALRQLHDFDVIHGAGHCSQIVFSMDRALKPCISAGSFAVRAGDAAAPLRSVMRRGKQAAGPSPCHPSRRSIRPSSSPAAIFFAGWRAAWTSVFALVLIGTYVGVGALAHEYGFSAGWVLLSTLLIWAAPAQVILLSRWAPAPRRSKLRSRSVSAGCGSSPMVVTLLALIKSSSTRGRPTRILAGASHRR